MAKKKHKDFALENPPYPGAPKDCIDPKKQKAYEKFLEDNYIAPTQEAVKKAIDEKQKPPTHKPRFKFIGARDCKHGLSIISRMATITDFWMNAEGRIWTLSQLLRMQVDDSLFETMAGCVVDAETGRRADEIKWDEEPYITKLIPYQHEIIFVFATGYEELEISDLYKYHSPGISIDAISQMIAQFELSGGHLFKDQDQQNGIQILSSILNRGMAHALGVSATGFSEIYKNPVEI